MKQQPTKKQWYELSKKEKALFWGKEDDSWNETILEDKLPFIGEMIEYLGDDWYRNEPIAKSDDYYMSDNKDLCNDLWEAVKYKLNNK